VGTPVAPSIIEKYQQILAADPRSRIFVELARALLDQGDARRAMEVCRAGLEHHPQSIQGRVIWGRALLAAGDAVGAHEQFDVAIGIDPGTPYGYNLVGEALVAAGRFKEALPVLTRAAELQPADAQARARLEEAKRRASGGTAAAIPAQVAPVASAPPSGPAIAAPAPVPGPPEDPALAARRAAPTRVGIPAAIDPGQAAPPTVEVAPDEATTDERTLRIAFEDLPAEAEHPPRPPPAPRPPPPQLARGSKGGLPGPRTLLGILPPSETEAPKGPSAASAPVAAEAARVASAYEHELREKAASAAAQAAAPSKRGRLVALVSLVVVLAGAGATFAWFRARSRGEELERALRDARVGMARDTRGSLAKAAEVLAQARQGSPGEARLLSLVAQVNGLLAAEHGEAPARAIALELVDPTVAGDGALAARWLVAANAADRAEAAKALLSTPAGATPEPIIDRLAGEVLLSRGELDLGRARLEKASGATPPQLAALALLGDSYLKAGDPERALAFYEGALRAQATHPRSVLGAAEARLALGQPLDGSLKELAAVEGDATSRPPVGDRLRFELTYARVLAATGELTGAVRRLTLAAGALGDSSRLEAVRAELLLDARRWEEAEAAAAKALRLEPKQGDHRVLLARARNGGHRFPAALQALEGQDGRAAWLERGVALHGLGRHEKARAALERTIRDGKMPAEAVTWYARSDLALGRTDRAVELLTKGAAAKGASALAQATLGEALLAAKRPAEAEKACQASIARDARSSDGPRCLGQVLLSTGRAAEAVAPLERAVALDQADAEAKRLLAIARAPAPAPKKAAPPKKPKR
jgi:tetratricopeptide (TPR) repeat protein